MIFNSNRSGKLVQPSRKPKTAQVGDDVRSGSLLEGSKLETSKIVPSGNKKRRIVVINGKVRIVSG